MMISGALTAVMGFLAIINNNWTLWNNNGAPYGSPYGWGWWNLLVGLVVIAIGAALMRGSMFARTVAVFVAAGSLVSQFVTLYQAPFWSLTVIVIDVLVIWAIMGARQGDEGRLNPGERRDQNVSMPHRHRHRLRHPRPRLLQQQPHRIPRSARPVLGV